MSVMAKKVHVGSIDSVEQINHQIRSSSIKHYIRLRRAS